MKLCTRCDTWKPFEEFSKDKSRKDGLLVRCKQCDVEYKAPQIAAKRARAKIYYAENAERIIQQQKDYYAANADVVRERQRAYNMKSKYGLTLDDYDRMLSSQDGICANPGCSNEPSPDRRLDVDHDHACCPDRKSCGSCVRGLLCTNCNAALGQVNDDLDRLRGLIDYLQSAQARQQQSKQPNSLTISGVKVA